ncbi:MAG: redoxin domain-containing protein [Planctomycetota bacterium]|jgi:peroxiredoxin
MRPTALAFVCAISIPLAGGPVVAQETEAAAEPDLATIGHSAHGAAFDQGPRQKPWKMDGIGRTHFPITTSVPEVQEWFDQGNTLLHNFWWFEAERCFRWCLKLDPECAMAYWGLARAAGNFGEQDRIVEFLKEAMRRKDNVTERERRYIEIFEKAYLPEYAGDLEPTSGNPREQFRKLADELELLVLDYPDDDEAKALFVLSSLYQSSRYGNEAIIKEILRSNPEHPGAHHYRIHNWDGKDGVHALDSCETYGRLAWYSGHANHMPGHIYSGIGLWHEGAIWMDSATRVEKKYMERRMTLPFHNWNYAHNRNYLSFIQEQLGLPTMAMDGGRQLLAAPLDPEYNPRDGWSVYRQGMQALVRGLVKFERWEAILEPDVIPWGDDDQEKALRAYCESLAHLGLGDLEKAIEQQAILNDMMKKSDGEARGREGRGGGRGRGGNRFGQRMLDELTGRIAFAMGDAVKGTRVLSNAAEEQWESYREENDPPQYPNLLYTVLGEAHLAHASPGLAAASFEKSLEVCPNDAFALSGLARARHALGEIDAATDAYGRLLFVWSDAESDLRWMNSARALGLEATPIDDAPRPQRNYRAQTLDELGPETWRPYAAPVLEALDAEKKLVTLDEYRGRNVLLVFYLGEGCAHCVEQLQAIGKRAADFNRRDVDLLAISSDTPDDHALSETLGELPFRLLSDTKHENARRFHAYDDFEDLELHATILIDGEGRIRWARTGGDPFMEFDFLLDEIDRVSENADLVVPTAAATR